MWPDLMCPWSQASSDRGITTRSRCETMSELTNGSGHDVGYLRRICWRSGRGFAARRSQLPQQLRHLARARVLRPEL